MIRNRITSLAAAGLVGGALVLAGCGSSSDTASTAAAAAPIPCIGAEEACTAKVPLGGGASARTVQIELTGTNMGEPKTTVETEYEGSYDITDATFTTGGSIYEFTLDAVESIPEGVNLEMTFAQKR
ncbi:MAG: hypothetical protein FJW99_00545 [Actinobacteria bacterium]|nr:hypothetical protein [Actinomycetota bacterium]MBM3697680.1 hypothetical protein [Actinomycetota bacterium]